MKIMVADDDRDMVDMLSYWLKGHGYDVIRAFDGEQAIKRWRETLPDLVILDVQMPKLDGFEVCRQMRSETNSMVLILTAHDREDDEIRGLEMGADDYLRKPFSPRQLLARIKALMRRSNSSKGSSSSSAISVGPVTLDAMRHEVTRDGLKVRLTPTESRLLHLLITHTGQVLTTDMIDDTLSLFTIHGNKISSALALSTAILKDNKRAMPTKTDKSTFGLINSTSL